MSRLLLVVVDDDRRALLTAILESAGHSVDAPARLDDALRLLAPPSKEAAGDPPSAGPGTTPEPAASLDAVIVDAGPGVDGAVRIIDAVRSHPDSRTAETPVVVSAHRNLPDDRLRALEAGCDAWLPRPHHVDELLTAIDEVGALPEKERADRRRGLVEAERQSTGR